MAIRSRIKSKIKSLIFRDSTRTSPSVDNTAQTISKTTFTAPNVSTSAQHPVQSSKEATTNTEKNIADTISDVTEPATPSLEYSETTSAEDSTDSAAQDSIEIESSADVEADLEGATFIVEVVDLFPETCPHCGASSHNNWIRIENKFACGSCEAAY